MNISEFFDNYVSNTLGGSSNQSRFESDGQMHTGRIYYKLFCGGKFEYSLLFSNISDSWFSTGNAANDVYPEWELSDIRAGICTTCSMDFAPDPAVFVPVTISGKACKTVGSGEIFYTDGFEIDANEGDYLCLEYKFKGTVIPNHYELWFASFVHDENSWKTSTLLPVPSMVGCNRKPELKVGFWGDSITQGIGPEPNSYEHWAAIVSEKLGRQYSYWNIGIGCGKSAEAATRGIWFDKAMQNDFIFLCLGVNDINGKVPLETIKQNLKMLVEEIKHRGKRVVIQGPPPFDYRDENIQRWADLKAYIETELAPVADGYFDPTPLLSVSLQEPHKAKFNPHPNGEGCRIWGEKLSEYLKTVI